MRNRKKYAKNFRKRAREEKEKAGWLCTKCGVAHGTLKISYWTGNEWPVYLQAHHVNEDPWNPDADLSIVCPSCHWRYFHKPKRGGRLAQWQLEVMKHRKLIARAFVVY